MNFQRSQSKVWFGSQQNSVYDNFYSLPTYYNTGKKSLQSISEQHEESMSPKSDSDELKRSMLIWGNRKSPSSQSYKSQDSGFSDAENSPTLGSNKKNISAVSSDEDVNQRSPSASSKVATPPTVIRRPTKIPIYEEISSVKRLSFSAPSSPNDFQSQIDEINFNTTSPLNPHETSRSSCRSCKLKRSRVITRNSSRRSFHSSPNESFDRSIGYNNETVYFGAGDFSLLEEKSLMESSPGGTSTPKSKKPVVTLESLAEFLPKNVIYKNHQLNGNFASVQNWIDTLHYNVSSEVMSALQTKSIETGNSVLSPAIAYKMIKNLQMKVFLIEKEFDAVEKCHKADEISLLLPSIQSLSSLIIDFVAKQELKNNFYMQSPKYYKQVVDNMNSIREMATDLKRLAGKIDLDDLEDYPMDEDLQLIKRYFLITVRIIFKLLVSVIVDNIEHAKNEMVLRSNMTHLATAVMSDEFNNGEGFSSLTDALITNSVVRVLLLVCIERPFETKHEWTRCLALRALSLVCTNEQTLLQFNINSGFEILRDTITSPKCSEQEIKEAISCLASITGPWQRLTESNFKDLKDYAEDYIEGITRISEKTESPQTLLICVAVLNNLSRLDSSSVYSLISHQSTLKIIEASERKVKGEYTIFLLEQITSLIFNMSINRKSHYHLTSRSILSFLYATFSSTLNKKYQNSAHTKAQHNVLENIERSINQLEAMSSNNDLAKISEKIRSKLEMQNDISSSSKSFNISNSSKNVTKISIFSQETFF